jgi:hypothetical protein
VRSKADSVVYMDDYVVSAMNMRGPAIGAFSSRYWRIERS